MSFSKPRLGVNIDHVATLRQARGESYPSLVDAASQSIDAGADQITIHLREDRRHIQDFDPMSIIAVTKDKGKLLNFEMGCAKEIIDIAVELKPQWICLVPEKREEQTTEGGLDLINESSYSKIQDTMKYLKAEIPDTKISLFVEAKQDILERCIALDADAVEIHTGDYAKNFLKGDSCDEFLKSFAQFKPMMVKANIGYHAGHGLTDKSLLPLLNKNLFEEYNIGHWIICDAVFNGIIGSVKNLKNLIDNN